MQLYGRVTSFTKTKTLKKGMKKLNVLNSNLYPPIMPDIQPAFIKQKKCKIYFTLPPYNDLNDIKGYQLYILDSNNNSVIAKIEKENLDFLQVANESQSRFFGEYYIEINGDIFPEQEIFYKIQMRFLSNTTLRNESSYSEWSKVSLIKSIFQPVLEIKNLYKEDNFEIILVHVPTEIRGKLNINNQSSEKLKNYSIQIFDLDSQKLFLKTDKRYPEKDNQIYYSFKKALKDGVSYKMLISYTTSGLYTNFESFYFKGVSIGEDKNIIEKFYAESNTEKGNIKITTIFQTPYVGNLIFRRASSKNNYQDWEDIHIGNVNIDSQQNFVSSYSWEDSTVESGIFYKYGVAILKQHNWRGSFHFSKVIRSSFQDMFLTSDNKTLKIKYNPSISNFKYAVSEAQQVTLGSQFPFITRTGLSYFRNFSIGGLITTYMTTVKKPQLNEDSNSSNSLFELENTVPSFQEFDSFISKDQIFSSEKNLQNQYDKENDIQQYENVIWEREYRESVINFLYKNNVKLFRSETEGNILVKLTDINLQPMEQLGRMLYSFSANATEIDEYSLYNIDKYNIQSIGTYKKVSFFRNELGQLRKIYTFNEKNRDILKNIKQHFSKKWENINILGEQLKSNEENFTINNIFIKNINFEISSPPYPIYLNQEGAPSITPFQNNTSPATVGYLLNFNNKPILIKPRLERKLINNGKQLIPTNDFIQVGYFQLPELKNIDSNSLFFEVPESFQIDAIINYFVEIHISKTENIPLYEKGFSKIGQVIGKFQPNQNIKSKILLKTQQEYQKNFNNTPMLCYKQLLSIYNLSFETDLNAVVYVKTLDSNSYEKHVIPYGFLQLRGRSEQDVVYIDDFYFKGIQMEERLDDTIYLRENEFVYEEDVLKEQALSPQQNHVYKTKNTYLLNNSQQDLLPDTIIAEVQNAQSLILTKSEEYFIYHQGKWYPFDKDNNIMLCPIFGIINYTWQGKEAIYQNVS